MAAPEALGRDPLCVCGHPRSQHTLFEHRHEPTGAVFTTEFCRHFDFSQAGSNDDDPWAGVCPCMSFTRARRFRVVADAA